MGRRSGGGESVVIVATDSTRTESDACISHIITILAKIRHVITIIAIILLIYTMMAIDSVSYHNYGDILMQVCHSCYV